MCEMEEVIFLPSSNMCDYNIYDYNICKLFNYQNTCSHVKLWFSTRTMASKLMSEVESFTIDSMIRGYHVYKDVWSSFIGSVVLSL